MNRRKFLQALAVAPAVAAVPALAKAPQLVVWGERTLEIDVPVMTATQALEQTFAYWHAQEKCTTVITTN